MKNIYFNGRADGLGNRIEELIHLEYHCIVNKTKCFYFWNNNNWRKYDLLIKCENIILQKDKKYPEEICIRFSSCSHPTSHEEMIQAAKNITYINPYILNNIPEYTTIHIRTTDKLLNRGSHEFPLSLLIEHLKKTISLVEKEKKICICADDNNFKKMLIKGLNKDAIIVSPFEDTIQNSVYKDYFTLVHSKNIYMCPKFSSFATTASLLGDNEIICYFPLNTLIGKLCTERYKCNIKYKTISI